MTENTAAPFFNVVTVAVPGPFLFGLDYLLPEDEQCQESWLGRRVKVPLRNREIISIVIAENYSQEISKLKPVIEIVDKSQSILSMADLRLLNWAAQYYHEPIGEVVLAALPKRIRQGEALTPTLIQRWQLTDLGLNADAEIPKRASAQVRLHQALRADYQSEKEGLSPAQCKEHAGNWRSFISDWQEKQWVRVAEHGCLERKSLAPAQRKNLNTEQQIAVDNFVEKKDKFACFLLQGVTGSGKTEVYLAMIEKVLAEGKQALVLVPEIGLTPQMVRRFEAYLQKPVVALHSGLNDSERHCAWYSMREGLASVILGTRSAVFTSCKNLGVCIIDEEHDLSYKQQDGFRYSARDLLIQRAYQQNIPIVLGSATPSLESFHNAKQQRFHWLKLQQRAAGAKLPEIKLLDIRGSKIHEGVSAQLRAAMTKHLDAGNQVLLFLNRRGFAPVLMCHECGWQMACPSCDANMTFHQTRNGGFLQCHHCDHQEPEPQGCPNCGSEEALLRIGQGTERLEETIAEWFPEKTVLRIDRDSTRLKGAMEALTKQAEQGEADILLGTQMLAKGHHFPNVTLVGLLDIDQGLFSIDYRGTERLAQLILQVAGRAGRAEKAGEVWIQTHHPDHPLLNLLLKEGYQAFAEQALQERKLVKLPPFSYQMLVRAEAYEAMDAVNFLESLKLGLDAEKLTMPGGEKMQILGPVSAPMLKRQGRFRYQLLLNSAQRNVLHQLMNGFFPTMLKHPLARKVRWSLDVDPQEMM